MKFLKRLLAIFKRKAVFRYEFGLRPDPEDSRDLVLGEFLIKYKLPQVIDWRDLKIPVKEQVGPSCVGFSSAGMKEIQEELEHERIFNFDGLKLYERCKELDGFEGGGTFIRIAMKVMQKEGAPTVEGDKFKIQTYTKLETIDQMRVALIVSGSFVGGIDIYENFTPDKNGVVPMPSGNKKGGHAILFTGYNDNTRMFRFKNSWGDDWGVNGYALLPYEFVSKHFHVGWAAIDTKDKLTNTFINTKKLMRAVKKAKNAKNSKKKK